MNAPETETAIAASDAMFAPLEWWDVCSRAGEILWTRAAGAGSIAKATARRANDLIEFARMTSGSIAQLSNAAGESVWRVTSEYILTTVMNISPERQGPPQFKKVAAIMRKWGWTKIDFRFGAKMCKGYERKWDG